MFLIWVLFSIAIIRINVFGECNSDYQVSFSHFELFPMINIFFFLVNYILSLHDIFLAINFNFIGKWIHLNTWRRSQRLWSISHKTISKFAFLRLKNVECSIMLDYHPLTIATGGAIFVSLFLFLLWLATRQDTFLSRPDRFEACKYFRDTD